MQHTLRMIGAAVVVAAMGMSSTAAVAELFETARTNTYGFVLGDHTFADARAHIHVSYDTQNAVAGDFSGVSFGVPTTAFNVSLTTTGGLVVRNVVIAPPAVTADLSCPDGVPGTREYDFDVPNGPAGPNCFLEEIGGRHALRWTSVAGGGHTGIPYHYFFTIPGDWSVAGTADGQHELLNISPDWTIDQDFVYHPSENLTVFEAHQDPYSAAPMLSLRIYGAPLAIPGDLNADGAVDGSDLAILLGGWGSAGPLGDLNGDGTVDAADLALLLGSWGG